MKRLEDKLLIKNKTNVSKNFYNYKKHLVLALILIPIFSLFGYQIYKDNFYTPSDYRVVELNDSLELTNAGRRLFYQSEPKLVDYPTLVDTCDLELESIYINYGCYDPSTDNIFLLNIADGPLKGYRITYAAHEILHHAYQELSYEDKKLVNSELKRLWDNNVISSETKDTIISGYDASVGTEEFFNELHSFVGTQNKKVTDYLETHYSIYFKDRSKLVGAYETVAENIRSIEEQINTKTKVIKSYESRLNQIESYASSIYNKLSNGYYYSTYTYNYDVSRYNSAVDDYDVLYAEYSRYYDSYTELVESLSGIYDNLLKPQYQGGQYKPI